MIHGLNTIALHNTRGGMRWGMRKAKGRGARARKGARRGDSAAKGGGVVAGGVIAERGPGVMPEYAPAFPVCLAAMARGAKRLEQINPERFRAVCLPWENMVHHFRSG